MPAALLRLAPDADNVGLVDAKGCVSFVLTGSSLHLEVVCPSAVYRHGGVHSLAMRYPTAIQLTCELFSGDSSFLALALIEVLVDPRRVGRLLDAAAQSLWDAGYRGVTLDSLRRLVAGAVGSLIESGALHQRELELTSADE